MAPSNRRGTRRVDLCSVRRCLFFIFAVLSLGGVGLRFYLLHTVVSPAAPQAPPATSLLELHAGRKQKLVHFGYRISQNETVPHASGILFDDTTTITDNIHDGNDLSLWLEKNGLTRAPGGSPSSILSDLQRDAGIFTLNQLKIAMMMGGTEYLLDKLPHLKKLEKLKLKKALTTTFKVSPVPAGLITQKPFLLNGPNNHQLPPLMPQNPPRQEEAPRLPPPPLLPPLPPTRQFSSSIPLSLEKATELSPVANSPRLTNPSTPLPATQRAVYRKGPEYPVALEYDRIGPFVPGPKSPLTWDGAWHRSVDQNNLNLVQGLYDSIDRPWLRSFAAQAEPGTCPSIPVSSSGERSRTHGEAENVGELSGRESKAWVWPGQPQFLVVHSKSSLQAVAGTAASLGGSPQEQAYFGNARNPDLPWLSAVAEQVLTFGVSAALLITPGGPFKDCAALMTANGCLESSTKKAEEKKRSALFFSNVRCVDVYELGPMCLLTTTGGSPSSPSPSSTSSVLAVWPSGDSLEHSDERRLSAFNRLLAPLLMGAAEIIRTTTNSAVAQSNPLKGAVRIKQHLAHVLGFSIGPGGTPLSPSSSTESSSSSSSRSSVNGGGISSSGGSSSSSSSSDELVEGVTVCLSRDDLLPETYAADAHKAQVPNAWVGEAQRFLQRNRRLGSIGCFPKFYGHNYADAPEYMQAAIKNVHYGLGFEDCANSVQEEVKGGKSNGSGATFSPPSFSKSSQQQHAAGEPSPFSSSPHSLLHSPAAVLGPDGQWREPFAYVALNPYGPQCFHLGKVAKAFPLEEDRRELFQPKVVAKPSHGPSTDPAAAETAAGTAAVSGEVDLSLRLWDNGLSVGLFDCGLDADKKKNNRRASYFPYNGALGVNNATSFTPLHVLKVWKQLLQSGPANLGLKDFKARKRASKVLLAAQIANHRLFQQRQEVLWPQSTALDEPESSLGAEMTAKATLRKDEAEAPLSSLSLPFPPLLVAPVPMMANANCQADPLELPLPRYGNFSEGLTLVLMSYAGGATQLPDTLAHYLDVISRDVVKEVVLVWNSPLHTLPKVVLERLNKNNKHNNAEQSSSTSSSSSSSEQESQHQQATQAQAASSATFRVVPFEVNSLLNRFHPNIQPRTRAVLFGDDDKRMNEASLKLGFAKWCCGNANRAVGAMGRRFWASKTGIEYHTSGRMQDLQMVIPTGMILDARYLCHFWRQTFQPWHDFVNNQPSKPDDIAVNMMMAFLTNGLGPRNYPQVVDKPGAIPAVTRRRRQRRRRRLMEQTQAATANHNRGARSSSGQYATPSLSVSSPGHLGHNELRKRRNKAAAADTSATIASPFDASPVAAFDSYLTRNESQEVLLLLRQEQQEQRQKKQGQQGHEMQGHERQGRRRLGMSGAAVWPVWRGDGALWLSYFFGGLPTVSPGYCNEGLPVSKWAHGCNSGLPVQYLHKAYGDDSDEDNATEHSGDQAAGTRQGRTWVSVFSPSDIKGLHVNDRKGMLPFTGQTSLKWLQCVEVHHKEVVHGDEDGGSGDGEEGDDDEDYDDDSDGADSQEMSGRDSGVGAHGVGFSNAAVMRRQGWERRLRRTVKKTGATTTTRSRELESKLKSGVSTSNQIPKEKEDKGLKKRRNEVVTSLSVRFREQELRLSRDRVEAAQLMAEQASVAAARLDPHYPAMQPLDRLPVRQQQQQQQHQQQQQQQQQRPFQVWRGWGEEAGLLLSSAEPTAHQGGGVDSRWW